MAFRQSTGLKNHLLNGGSYADAFTNGELRIYSGTQPSSANTAPSGTLLATLTDASASRTAEVRATGSVELTAGASGSIDDLTIDSVSIIDGVVAFNTSLAQTATDLAAAINQSNSVPEYTASASSATVTITAARGAGADANSLVVASSVTTITTTDTNMASGVSAVNGLKFNKPAAGSLTKRTGQSWSGVGAANGTAGWARFVGAVADADGTDALEAEIRLDGVIATSGGEYTMTSLTVSSGATQSVTDFELVYV